MRTDASVVDASCGNTIVASSDSGCGAESENASKSEESAASDSSKCCFLVFIEYANTFFSFLI